MYYQLKFKQQKSGLILRSPCDTQIIVGLNIAEIDYPCINVITLLAYFMSLNKNTAVTDVSFDLIDNL